ncbi:MAG: alpha/beta fold hydrolase [Spirochaetes bacterium]|nr:alpha/beta fold hydrolase [Spirochaetota bacterium]
MVITPKVWNYDETYKNELKCNRFTEQYYKSLPKEEFFIESPNGYRLHAMYIPKGSNKTVIFVHGHTYTLMGDIKYLEIFRSLGFNALLFDSRFHGKSGGGNTTFGKFEKYDVKACVDWVSKKHGSNSIIGLHGESMGSAICLLYAATDTRCSFYIVDGAMADLPELLSYRLRKDFGMPAFPLLHAASIVSRLRGAMLFSEISPISVVNNITAPVFFIHGGDDTDIPVEHAKRLYNTYTGTKKIWICPGATHSKSIVVNREEYERQVKDFLKMIKVI